MRVGREMDVAWEDPDRVPAPFNWVIVDVEINQKSVRARVTRWVGGEGCVGDTP